MPDAGASPLQRWTAVQMYHVEEAMISSLCKFCPLNVAQNEADAQGNVSE